MTGILNIIKPPNMTSQDVVSYLRGVLHERRIGHGGTLDPGASGVLPVFVGKATRLCDYSIQGDKEYLGEITFGASTDTQDSYGNVIARSDAVVSLSEVKEAFSTFVGEITQQTPMYSAIKIGGKKLYQIARSGKEIEAPLRDVTIYRAEVLEQIEENRFTFIVRCSKGTYIRALCHDIGKKLGCPSHLSFLLRTGVGIFTLERGCTLDEVRYHEENGTIHQLMMSADSAVMDLPSLVVEESAFIKFSHGATAPLHLLISYDGEEEGRLSRVYLKERFAGLGMITPDGIRMNKMILEDHHESMG